MTDTVNVPRADLEKIDSFLRMVIGLPYAHGIRSSIRAMLAAAPKAEPVSDPYKLDSVVRILTGQHKGKTGTIEMEHPVRGLAMRIFLVQIEDGPTANYRADEIEPADTEALKVEQEPFGYSYETIGGDWVLRQGEVIGGTSGKPLYDTPAPASDELLEALEAIAQSADDFPKTEGVGEAQAYRYGLEVNADRARTAIAKHKGPQS